METAESLGAKPGGEVKMGNVSLELPILVRSAVRLFSAMTGLVLSVRIKQPIILKLAVEKYTSLKQIYCQELNSLFPFTVAF